MSVARPVIERHGDFFVCRDDLLAGGTKRRALIHYLPKFKINHFYYAGTVFGSGAWALAEACRDLNYSCTLFISDNAYKPSWTEKFAAQIEWQNPAPVQAIHNVIEAKARERGSVALSLGFNDPVFKDCLTDSLKDISMTSKEIWMPCVSGTMVNAAQTAWPDKKINAVCVAKNHGDLGHARKYQAEEKYHHPAREMPPFPSNIFSDAKLWSVAKQFALKNSLIWNTSA